APVRWLVDSVSRIAPQIPVRDLPTLQRHHGLDGPDLADRLLRNAARATAGIGAASGGLAAVQWSVPPTLLSAPVLLSIETVAVVAVELKLLGELHAVYRVPLPARGTQRAWALVRAWTHQRGIDPFLSGGVGAALRPAARRELADRLTPAARPEPAHLGAAARRRRCGRLCEPTRHAGARAAGPGRPRPDDRFAVSPGVAPRPAAPDGGC